MNEKKEKIINKKIEYHREEGGIIPIPIGSASLGSQGAFSVRIFLRLLAASAARVRPLPPRPDGGAVLCACSTPDDKLVNSARGLVAIGD